MKKEKTELTAQDKKSSDHAAIVGEDAADFIAVEKNLIELGYFSPTSRGKRSKMKSTRVKTVRLPGRRVDGKQTVNTIVKIITGGIYGLPGTADLDRWLAFMKLVNNMHFRVGQVTNPISFTSWELLSLLGVDKHSGNNQESVGEWLDRMYATTIEIEGDGVVSGQRRFVKQNIRVFDERVSKGRELEPGVIADKNYVWLSDWQLHNINSNLLIPIDFDTYRAIRNPIAKALVPLLQVWLYATRTKDIFVKNYGELCQLLGISQWRHKSTIEQKLAPSLDELRVLGYIAGWGVEQKKRGDGWKLVFRHGEKFYRDLAQLESRQTKLPAPTIKDEADLRVIEMLVQRGITEGMAVQLIRNRAPGQIIEDHIEYVDHLIETKGSENFRNPPGLYIHIISLNAAIIGFEPSRLRVARELAAATTFEAESRLYKLQCAYGDYKQAEITRHLGELSAQERERLTAEARAEFEREFADAAKVFNEENIRGVVESMVEKKIGETLDFMSFEEFAASRD